ncbi:trypsin-like peptidase domain-containing protein [Micromonospora sp. DR5-3]|uniref:trypsin-like peptidase domain-containing protein n=1 Tax=unclassified Micromonospora TaxID=2617518 RepID=UPI0011D39E61|nr:MULTISPECIES: trypsin-like peptidase domain-containing protein [unclassified Micromonospora]MCW3815478.1 trypsin-like peptidase domain-containing protein [Micromonospora sp. DR5-3]TYC24289.1 hypothetical protein FXF52_11080 [Micromonospora sp. MP36]
MQPVGPYRFTEALGVCQVGTAWWAVDGQDRLVTVAVLEGAAAADQPWRQAFANAANAMAQAPGGQRYVNADFAAARPWAAYASEEGMGAQRLFQTLGMELQPAESEAEVLIPATGTVAQPPQPVSGAPVSGTPTPTSGAPLPWAMHATAVPQQPVEAAPISPARPVLPTEAPPADPFADPFADPARRIQPSPAPTRSRGLRAALVAGLVVLLAAAGTGALLWANSGEESSPNRPDPGTGFATTPATASASAPGLKPWAQAAPYSPEERALAIAAPSLVFVEASFTGFLRNTKTGAPISPTPVTFKRRCSGFVVNSDGTVLTNGQCVRPTDESARERALYTLGRILVDQKRLAPTGLDGYVRSKLAVTRFTGTDPAAPFTSQVSAQFNVARGDLATSPAIPGEVVRVLEPDAGNLAVVKLPQAKLPAVELATAAPPGPGTVLLVLGYQTTDTAFRGARFTLDSKVVQVTGTGNQGSVAVQRVNDGLGIYSHGGIAVDTAGRVVGVLDSDRAADGGANRALVPVSTVTGLLTEAGVDNTLSATDKLYRSGLDAWFSGRTATAVSHLDAVADAQPTNLLAQAYRQSAADRDRLEADEPSPSALPAVIFAALGGALVVGLLALLLRRRQR